MTYLDGMASLLESFFSPFYRALGRFRVEQNNRNIYLIHLNF
jgi:hypothetical protein